MWAAAVATLLVAGLSIVALNRPPEEPERRLELNLPPRTRASHSHRMADRGFRGVIRGSEPPVGASSRYPDRKRPGRDRRREAAVLVA